MIPAVFAPAVALLARVGPQLARLEARHWVALTGSAALHLGVLLGLEQTPAPPPQPLTFEVKLDPPPEMKPPRPSHVAAKTKAMQAKKAKIAKMAKKKPAKAKPREADTLLADWQPERRRAKDIPEVTLPQEQTLASAIAAPQPPEPAHSQTPALVAKAATADAQAGSATAATSEPSSTTQASDAARPLAGQTKDQALGIALAAAQGLDSAEANGAQGSSAPAMSAASSGNQARDALSGSAAAGGGFNLAASAGGLQVQASDASSRSAGALASGEPEGVRLSLSGVLSSLAALPAGSGSLAGGELSGAAGGSAATAGVGAEASLATAASRGEAATVAVAGTPLAGAGSDFLPASEHGVAASGGGNAAALPAAAIPATTRANTRPAEAIGSAASGGMASASSPATAQAGVLAHAGAGDHAGRTPMSNKHGAGLSRAASSPAAAAVSEAGSGQLAQAGNGQAIRAAQGQTGARGRADTAAANTRGLAGSGQATGMGRLASASGQALARSAQADGGTAFSPGRATAAALAAGEPGSTPGLAVALPAVPAILEIRGAGHRAGFQGARAGGEAGRVSGSGSMRLAQADGSGHAALPLRDVGTSGLATTSGRGSLASGGTQSGGNGKLENVKVVAVEQIRADSEVKPLDVLAPSTYCPLPGHVMPDNRPTDTTQSASEKPAYASENPSIFFPIRAWAYGHEGRVVVRVQVLPDGSPGSMWIKQSSGSGILDVDAREQLAKYRFKPARKNGQPVSAWIDVPVDYRLNVGK